MDTLADRINAFNQSLSFWGTLPKGIRVLNPFQENLDILKVSSSFYNKFYKDSKQRKLILGINPGRLGAGATGIPFTDTKRLIEVCQLEAPAFHTHEPSSVFIYKLIEAFGGPKAFYGRYYINSVCPLGFVTDKGNGRWVNYNYYDNPVLFKTVRPFIIKSLKAQLNLGLDSETCWVLGKKNALYLAEINREIKIFKRLIPLDHPRYIMQYKAREADDYLHRYLELLH
jgi:hypothetical protein